MDQIIAFNIILLSNFYIPSRTYCFIIFCLSVCLLFKTALADKELPIQPRAELTAILKFQVPKSWDYECVSH